MNKESTFKNSIRVSVASTTEKPQPSKNKSSIRKHRCFKCDHPLKTTTIRKTIICPNCGTKNLIE